MFIGADPQLTLDSLQAYGASAGPLAVELEAHAWEAGSQEIAAIAHKLNPAVRFVGAARFAELPRRNRGAVDGGASLLQMCDDCAEKYA